PGRFSISGDRMAAHRRSDQRHAYLYTDGLRKRGSLSLSECLELIVKGKRILCPPQYGRRYPQGVPRRLGESRGFEHGFPLIRSLRASAQRSTSVLFSFVLSLLIVAGSSAIRQSKTILAQIYSRPNGGASEIRSTPR